MRCSVRQSQIDCCDTESSSGNSKIQAMVRVIASGGMMK
jgi:hypothetical protein